MPSSETPPRIRIDFSRSPPGLPSSNTLDIREILDQERGLPELLVEDPCAMLHDTDDLYLEGGDAPTFPHGHQPPLFIVNPHRAQLPFPIRLEVLELGDICYAEDAPPVLTTPTIPRMKMMIKEHLYVQKWIDTLTLEDPPKHIPWTCDKPVPDTKWVSEGSISPADTTWSFTGQRRNTRGRVGPIVANGAPARDKEIPVARSLRMLREASVAPRSSTGTHRWTVHMPVKPVVLGLNGPEGESKNSEVGSPESLRDILRSQEIPTPSRPVRSVPLIESPPSTPDVLSLAARRGKALSDLQLSNNLMQEYPDIPTAFRGSPSVWSPQFHVRLPDQPFVDHLSMLSNLRSKCAALASGPSVPIETGEEACPWPPPGLTPGTSRTSLSSDEWGFTRQLTDFENDLMGSFGESGQVSQSFHGQIGDTTIGTRSFLPEESSGPTEGPGSRTKSERRLRPHSSTPAMRHPVSNPSGPPEVALPPRPALINPATPSCVRGILKKAKSVRFEDAIAKESTDQVPSPPAPEVTPKRPSPLRQSFTASSEQRLTPVPNDTQASKNSVEAIAVEVKPASEKGASEKQFAPRPRLGPRGTIYPGMANRPSGLPALRPKDGNAQGTGITFKPPSGTTSVERPCRIAHANKENADPAAVPKAQRKQRWSTTEGDVRRGLEGPLKSRLSTPLRNIFRFR
ncbi:hypothetical protein PAXRUDRAFT_607410 [Paxillus rubicundulus Ve08.2h10]|uniref:Uncharacterized protein n=1 Tax=Paxillus rubicundulus Ve08.2h10 TaxID=930991 RepID=A0A0D0E422_9AGAM|nr:hypothetical protein PAXRUDRAFT_607410 [Paxillus rubicundulus Ve08.2h10]